jgi:subtilisin family serine protease
MKTVNHKQSAARRIWIVACVLLFLLSSVAQPAQAQLLSGLLGGSTSTSNTRLIVRDSLGLTNLLNTCLLLGCKVEYGLGDPQNQLFLVSSSLLDVTQLIGSLRLNLFIVSIELDQPVRTMGAYAGSPPSYLSDTKAVNYYGTSVWHGYTAQTPNSLIRTSSTQSTYKTTGYGVTVAVIDTGVDPNQPVLKPFLTAGYDFTRNASNNGSEMNDVSASPNLSNADPGDVNQSTVAVLDQSTVAVLDGNGKYAAFGHGTMTAGLVHLVAPQAKIMPLKAFKSDGTGYDSDVPLRLLRGEERRQGAEHEL